LLKEVLREINESNYISKSNIALKLNRSKALIEDAFSQLARMGYIKENDNNMVSCVTECKGCPFAKSCNKLPAKSIVITEKGKKLLEN
jgi:predicted transcriptional regulator